MSSKRVQKAKVKRQNKKRIKNAIEIFLLFIVIIVAGYFIYRSLTQPPVVPLVYTSNLKKEEWMQYIPEDVVHFRVFNFTEINKSHGAELFKNKTVLQFVTPTFAVKSNDVEWAIEIELSDSSIVNVLSLKHDTLQYIKRTVSSYSLIEGKYFNVPLYILFSNVSGNIVRSKLAIWNSCIIYTEYSDQAIKKILMTALNNISSIYHNTDFRVAFQLATNQKSFIVFSLTAFVAMKDLNITWQVSALQQSDSSLTKFDVYRVQSQEYAINVFYDAKKWLFVKSQKCWITDKFIVAEFAYPISDLREVIMEM
ncbi:MAG: hypothetical protein ACP5KW_10755 [Thermoproteota archaeon]